MNQAPSAERTFIEAWTKLKTQYRRVEGAGDLSVEGEADFLAALRAFGAEFDEVKTADEFPLECEGRLSELRAIRSLRSMSDAQRDSWQSAWKELRAAVETWLLQSGRRKVLLSRLARSSRKEMISKWLWIPLAIALVWALGLAAVIWAFLKR